MNKADGLLYTFAELSQPESSCVYFRDGFYIGPAASKIEATQQIIKSIPFGNSPLGLDFALL